MKGKEILIFLFFLMLAGISWLLMTLNESFEQEVKIPVHFVNVPRDVVITSGEEDTLRVTVRDKGISLMTYLYKSDHKAVEISFNRYASSDGTGSVPKNDLLRLVRTRLPASATPVSVKPETHIFYYNYGEKKRVPVEYQGKVVAEQLHYISGVSYSPDSVTIYASREKLDSIDRVYTEPIHLTDFRDSASVQAHLQRTTGVKTVPAQVAVTFFTDVLTEVTIADVPVVGINMPPGAMLRTFPAKLSVHFVTGLRNYQAMSADDFLIVADYNELAADSDVQCNVYLRRQPAGIQRVRLQKERVDYLIEKH